MKRIVSLKDCACIGSVFLILLKDTHYARTLQEASHQALEINESNT